MVRCYKTQAMAICFLLSGCVPTIREHAIMRSDVPCNVPHETLLTDLEHGLLRYRSIYQGPQTVCTKLPLRLTSCAPFSADEYGVFEVSFPPCGHAGRVASRAIDPAILEDRRGDLDGDDCVLLRDFSMLAQAFGTIPGMEKWNEAADLDCDAVVGLVDFSLLSVSFGQCGDAVCR